jgi:glycosyltransferase involved in cell wall biosynthesis
MSSNTSHRGATVSSTPELSIIVSCFNQAEILESALRDCFRVVGARVTTFETIIINDGSTDGSVRILDRLRKEFPHVRVTHQLHSGLARAVRRGCDLARGEFLFQVDLSQPDCILDFGRFWELRDRYALVLGFHPYRGGRLSRGLLWLQTRWIKLWFGAELVEPDACYRLCRRELAHNYLLQIPANYEGVNLGLTLAAYRDAPRLILEIEVGNPALRPRHTLREQLGKFYHYFIEIAQLRISLFRLPALQSRAHAS